MRPVRKAVIGVLLAAGILFPAASAHAHAQFLGSDPKPGASVKEVPSSMALDFSEPPVSGDNVVVEDGCGTDVVTAATVDEKRIDVSLGEGQPGKWKVALRVISAVDGHPTEKSFSFKVAGEADCTKGSAAPDPAPRGEEDSGSSMPVVAGLVVLTLLAVGAAFELRRRLP